jgi:S-DNA-T family DNA segregation ATPase FtsK/SpoIIIE
VIDIQSRRRTAPTESDPVLIVGKKRRLPTLPSGVGAAVIAAPAACACCIGRGIKRGGDAWGDWVSEAGHRVERAKKSFLWAIGGVVVCAFTAPFGIIVIAATGLVAAAVAGRRPRPGKRGAGVRPGAPRVEAGASLGEAALEAGVVDAASAEAPAVAAPPAAGEVQAPGPVVVPTVRTPATAPPGRVPVGPPSTSPLVGRTHPVDVWTEAVRWGIDAFGVPVETVLPGNPGLLTGGVSGSGKSVASHQMLCTVALDPHARLWLVDGKMVELIHYKDIAHEYLDEPDLEAFTELVDKLDAEMQRRKRAISGKAVKITGKNWRLYDAPFTLLHIDEIQIYTLQGKDGQKLAQRLALIASQCRALGIFVSVATQRPEDSVVPPLLCNNLVLKLALRAEDAAQSNTILGNGMAGRGYRSDRFTGDQKGGAYFRGEVGDPIALTTGYLRIPDEDEGGPDHVRDIVRVATELRRAAGTLPAEGDRASRAERLEIVADAVEAMDAAGVDRMSRVRLAEAMGWADDELRDALTATGVCSPHSLAGEAGRGWYRRDLEAVMVTPH